MKQSEVADLVAVIAAAFPNQRPTERTCQVYESLLVDLDFATTQRAVARLLATSKFMPTIAEIRAAVVEVQHGARRLGGEAWGDVNEAVRRVGRNGVPEFSDPITAECVRQLGWLSLCNSTNDVADRARFVELYDGLATRRRADEVAGASLALPSPAGQPGALPGGFGRSLPEAPRRASAREQLAAANGNGSKR